MINYSYLIVDDSPSDATILQRQLAQITTLKQVTTCGSIEEALAFLLTQPCHLLFLDIKLSGQSGIEWLRESPNRPPVIITTNYPEYALDCYDLDVVDFLVKPYTTDRLARSIHRALARPTAERTIQSQSIFLYVNRKLQRFNFNDITHLEAIGAYTKIHTVDGTYSTSESISMVEARLPQSQFLRIQKSFLINLDKLTMFEHRAVWIGSVKLSIGQQYRETFSQLLRGRSKKGNHSEIEG
ncbi:response regulator [Rudanella paleaurantiibacter]|uniref:Response regulator n=1 Tax=Rudanella paleaurantiibacter TaxID=2614655 RepID=A0A7J5TTB8_9BACT|nr:response regulator [Rudanella paleaurantiibacter]KAB7726887.1 response regulator [Rudanella paleaurantiibacter]